MNFSKERIDDFIIMREHLINEIHEVFSQDGASCCCIYGPEGSGKRLLMSMYASDHKEEYTSGIWWFNAQNYLSMGRSLREMLVDLLGTENFQVKKDLKKRRKGAEEERPVSFTLMGLHEMMNTATNIMLKKFKNTQPESNSLFIVSFGSDLQTSFDLMSLLPKVPGNVMIVAEEKLPFGSVWVEGGEEVPINYIPVDPPDENDLIDFHVEEFSTQKRTFTNDDKKIFRNICESVEYDQIVLSIMKKFLIQVDKKSSMYEWNEQIESYGGGDILKLVFMKLRSMSMRSKQRNERIFVVQMEKYPTLVNSFDVLILSCLMGIDVFSACRIHKVSYFRGKNDSTAGRRTVFSSLEFLHKIGFYRGSLGLPKTLHKRLQDILYTVCPREEIKQYLRTAWCLLNPTLNDFAEYAFTTNPFSVILMLLRLVESSVRYGKYFGKDFPLMNSVLRHSLDLIVMKFHPFFYVEDPGERQIMGIYIRKAVQRIAWMTKNTHQTRKNGRAMVNEDEEHENHTMMTEDLSAVLARLNNLVGERDAEKKAIGGDMDHEWMLIATAEDLQAQRKAELINELMEGATFSLESGFSESTIVELKILHMESQLHSKEFIEAQKTVDETLPFLSRVCAQPQVEVAELILIKGMIFYEKMNRFADAKRTLEALNESHVELKKASPEHIRGYMVGKTYVIAASKYVLGLVGFRLGDYAYAEKQLQGAVAEFKEHVDNAGLNTDLIRIFVSKCYLALGIVLTAQQPGVSDVAGSAKSVAQGAAYLTTCLDEFKRLERPKYICDANAALSTHYLRAGDTRKAIVSSKAGIAAMRAYKKQITQSLLDCYMNLGLALKSRDDLETAVMMCRYAVAQWSSVTKSKSKVKAKDGAADDVFDLFLDYKFRNSTIPLIVAASLDVSSPYEREVCVHVDNMYALAQMYERSKKTSKALRYYRRSQNLLVETFAVSSAVNLDAMEKILASIVRIQVQSGVDQPDEIEKAAEFQLRFIKMLTSIEEKEKSVKSKHDFQNNLISAQLDACEILFSNSEFRKEEEINSLLVDMEARIKFIKQVGGDDGIALLEAILFYRMGVYKSKMLDYGTGLKFLLNSLHAFQEFISEGKLSPVRRQLSKAQSELNISAHEKDFNGRIKLQSTPTAEEDQLSARGRLINRNDTMLSLNPAAGGHGEVSGLQNEFYNSSYRPLFERFGEIAARMEILYFELGYCHYMLNETGKSCEMYEKGIGEISAKAMARHEMRKLVKYFKDYSDVLRDCGKIDLSNLYINKGLEVVLFETDTNAKGNQSDEEIFQISSMKAGIAQNAMIKNQIPKSIKYLEEAVALLEGKDYNLEMGLFRSRLAYAYMQNEEYPKAFDSLNESLRLRILIYGSNHLIVAKTYEMIAAVTCKIGGEDRARVINYYKAAISIVKRSVMEKTIREGLSWIGRLHLFIGKGYLDSGELEVAIMHFRDSLTYFEMREDDNVTEHDRTPYLNANSEDSGILENIKYVEEARACLMTTTRELNRMRRKCTIL